MYLPPFAQLCEAFGELVTAVIICDAKRIRYANPACADLLGYEEVQCLEGLHAIDDIVCPEDRHKYRESIHKLIEGVVGREEVWVWVRRANGSLFRAHVRAHTINYPDQRCALLTLTDVTAVTARRRPMFILRRAIAAVSEAVVVINPSGLIRYANRAADQLFGAEDRGLIGANIHSFLEEDASAVALQKELDAGDERHIQAEVSLRRVSGNCFPASVTAAIFYEEEEGELAIIIVRDLTEAKRVDEERRWRERQLRAMLREAHHRIKNSLQVASDLLILQANVSSREVAEALRAAATRISALAAVHEGISPNEERTAVHTGALLEAIIGDSRGGANELAKSPPLHLEIEDVALTPPAASALALCVAELRALATYGVGVRHVGIRLLICGEDAVLEVIQRRTDETISEAFLPPFSARLVRLLVEEQLHGTFEIDEQVGQTTIVIRFPLAGNTP
ncbi:MAG: sensor histidine kinase [Candidatus Zipacnadales bacterium]